MNAMSSPLRCFDEIQKKFVILSYEANKKFVRKIEYHVKSFKVFLRSPIEVCNTFI